jgi:hypothetical protein
MRQIFHSLNNYNSQIIIKSCFERSKTQHTDTCKKLLDKAKKIKNPIVHSNPKEFNGKTLYNDSYIKFEKKNEATNKLLSSSVSDFDELPNSRRTKYNLIRFIFKVKIKLSISCY